jgi:hypothetical protein
LSDLTGFFLFQWKRFSWFPMADLGFCPRQVVRITSELTVAGIAALSTGKGYPKHKCYCCLRPRFFKSHGGTERKYVERFPMENLFPECAVLDASFPVSFYIENK